MATGDIGSVLDTLQFEAGATDKPSIAFGLGNLAVIVVKGPTSYGWMYTCLIDSLGAIPAAIADSWQFDSISCDFPLVVHVSGDIFACLYCAPSFYVECFTFSVSSLGIITKSKIDSDNIRKPDDSADDQGYPYSFFEKSPNNFAFTYQTYSAGGPRLGILGISGAGVITGGIIASLTLTHTGAEPHQTLVSASVGVVAYRGPSNHLYIETHSFTSLIDIYDMCVAIGSPNPKIAKIHSNVYAVSFSGGGDAGILNTCFISAAGAITKNIESTLTYDPPKGICSDLLCIGDGVVAIAYGDNDSDGQLKTYPISGTAIIGSIIDSLEFDTTYARWPRIALRTGNIYAIAYRGTGEVITVGMETPALARPHHELVMGIGP